MLALLGAGLAWHVLVEQPKTASAQRIRSCLTVAAASSQLDEATRSILRRVRKTQPPRALSNIPVDLLDRSLPRDLLRAARISWLELAYEAAGLSARGPDGRHDALARAARRAVRLGLAGHPDDHVGEIELAKIFFGLDSGQAHVGLALLADACKQRLSASGLRVAQRDAAALAFGALVLIEDRIAGATPIVRQALRGVFEVRGASKSVREVLVQIDRGLVGVRELDAAVTDLEGRGDRPHSPEYELEIVGPKSELALGGTLVTWKQGDDTKFARYPNNREGRAIGSAIDGRGVDPGLPGEVITHVRNGVYDASNGEVELKGEFPKLYFEPTLHPGPELARLLQES